MCVVFVIVWSNTGITYPFKFSPLYIKRRNIGCFVGFAFEKVLLFNLAVTASYATVVLSDAFGGK